MPAGQVQDRPAGAVGGVQEADQGPSGGFPHEGSVLERLQHGGGAHQRGGDAAAAGRAEGAGAGAEARTRHLQDRPASLEGDLQTGIRE